MQVTFQRTGGFAGMKITKVVDTATLPLNEANQLRQLVDAADFFRLPANIPSTSQPDRFVYQLKVEENGKQPHAIAVGEQAIPGTLRPLLDWLMAVSR